MGVSENSVAINPLVLLIIIPMKNCYFIGNIPNIFRQTHMGLKSHTGARALSPKWEPDVRERVARRGIRKPLLVPPRGSTLPGILLDDPSWPRGLSVIEC